MLSVVKIVMFQQLVKVNFGQTDPVWSSSRKIKLVAEPKLSHNQESLCSYRVVWSIHVCTLCLKQSVPLGLLSISLPNINRHSVYKVAWWLSGQCAGFWTERSRVRLTASPLPSNNSGQAVHTHVPLRGSLIYAGTTAFLTGKCSV